MKNQLLRDSDLFGMHHSLEIRIPFLDTELVDYILRVDPKEKFGQYNKKILSDISKNILPSQIIKRPKKGFELPFKSWFLNNIDKFNVDKKTKINFKNGDLTWSRVWALLIIGKFDEKL